MKNIGLLINPHMGLMSEERKQTEEMKYEREENRD